MALNFPDSPSNGDTTTLNGVSYTYDSTKTVWVSTTGPITTVAVSDTAPTTPTDGDMWFNSSDLKLYIRYNDGATSQWIIAAPAGPAGADSTVAGPAGGDGRAGVYADMAALIAKTGMVAGDTALVTALNKVFMYTGSAWFLIATMTNNSPTAITGVDGSYDLATDGTATTITAVSTDPEGFALTWSYAVTTGSLGSTATVSQADNVFTITPSTTEADAGSFSITFSVTDGATGAVSAVSAFTLAFTSWATPSHIVDLSGPAGEVNAYLGERGLAVSGNHLLASTTGRFGGTLSTDYTGTLQYYTKSGNTWTLQQSIQPSDLGSSYNNTGIRFGSDVRISGDGNTFVCLATAYNNIGAIFIYTRSGNTWTQQELIPGNSSTWSTDQSSYSFGSDDDYTQERNNPLVISHDGNFIAVGSFKYANQVGAVHTFVRNNNTWAFQQYIAPSVSCMFGHGMAYAEDTETLMVGAPRADVNFTNSGTIFFYHKNGAGTWTLDTQIDGQEIYDYFGGWSTISKDGMTAAWGPNSAVLSTHASRTTSNEVVHVYTNDGTANGGVWTLQQVLSPSTYVDGDGFGKVVELSDDGNTILVTSPDKHVTVSGTEYNDLGQAYIFTRSGNTWTEFGVIDIPTGSIESDKEFGKNAALSDDGKYAYLFSHGTDNDGDIHIYEEG
jgi:hypothetical protein